MTPKLVTASSKEHVSVVRLPQFWYIACFSTELNRAPISRTILGMPLVLFRDHSGAPAALLDRCPHRNVPLSMGTIVQGSLECRYHGWCFNREGHCINIPGLQEEARSRGRDALSFATIEQEGCVWVYATLGVKPQKKPFEFPAIHDARYTTVRQTMKTESSLFSMLENVLDVPHTAFLHHGLFRTARRGITIEAIVRTILNGVEAEYVGEPRPSGLVGRLLSPASGTVTHFDRFLMPSIAQVEYRLGEDNHLLISAVMTPETDFLTRMYAVISFRLRVPSWLVRPLVTPIGKRIFAQDAEILKAQTQQIHLFKGEQFVSTEIDVLGKHIWRLLKHAERGDEVIDPKGSSIERRVKLIV